MKTRYILIRDTIVECNDNNCEHTFVTYHNSKEDLENELIGCKTMDKINYTKDSCRIFEIKEEIQEQSFNYLEEQVNKKVEEHNKEQQRLKEKLIKQREESEYRQYIQLKEKFEQK